MELDLYWAVHAGADAAQLIDRLSTRLYAFHDKDMKKDKTMAAVGAGTIDFAALFKRPGASQVTPGRKSVAKGTGVSIFVDIGGRRNIKKKKHIKLKIHLL